MPRRRTELMARAAIGMVSEGDVAVELCCGAAPVATAMAAAMPSARVYAGDIDERAVACARLSLERFGGRAAAGDLFDARVLIGRR